MNMIIVAVEIGINEGVIDQKVHEILRVVELETQKEPGCIKFVFTVDVNDPAKLRIYEEWDNMEALRAHFGMPHMPPFMEKLNEIQQSMNVNVYEISKVADLPTRLPITPK